MKSRSDLQRAQDALEHGLALLCQARDDGDALKAELAQDAIDHILDHYRELQHADQHRT